MFPFIPQLFTGAVSAFSGINLGRPSTNNSEQIYLAQLAAEKKRKENTIIIISCIALVAIIGVGGIIWYKSRK
jgi:hypothetical protein